MTTPRRRTYSSVATFSVSNQAARGKWHVRDCCVGEAEQIDRRQPADEAVIAEEAIVKRVSEKQRTQARQQKSTRNALGPLGVQPNEYTREPSSFTGPKDHLSSKLAPGRLSSWVGSSRKGVHHP